MAELMVASFGPGRWVLHNYGNRRPNNQPLVFVRDGLTDADHVAPFTLGSYVRSKDKSGNTIESGKYHRLGRCVSLLDGVSGHMAKVYTAKSMAEYFAKAVFERLGLDINSDAKLCWYVLEDNECFYKNEASVQFFNSATGAFIVGIDVYIYNPYLEQMPAIVFGRRDVEYRNEDTSTWDSSETYKNSEDDKNRLLGEVVEDIEYALTKPVFAPAAVPVPESKWFKPYTPIKPFGLGENGEVIETTEDPDDDKLWRSLAMVTGWHFEDDNPPTDVKLSVKGRNDNFVQKMCIYLAQLGFYARYIRPEEIVIVSTQEIAPF